MAKHSCEMCRPFRRDLNRLKAGHLLLRRHTEGDIEVATYKLDIVRELVCSDSPPDVDEDYRPGGARRTWFLEHRMTAACAPCQRLADELVIVTRRARALRDALQQERQSPGAGNSTGVDPTIGQDAALQAHFARALEELLRECERINCQGSDDGAGTRRRKRA